MTCMSFTHSTSALLTTREMSVAVSAHVHTHNTFPNTVPLMGAAEARTPNARKTRMDFIVED